MVDNHRVSLRFLNQAKTREKHKGHEKMHLEMLIVLITTLAVAQIVLIQWKQRHFRSYQLATTLGNSFERNYLFRESESESESERERHTNRIGDASIEDWA